MNTYSFKHDLTKDQVNTAQVYLRASNMKCQIKNLKSRLWLITPLIYLCSCQSAPTPPPTPPAEPVLETKTGLASFYGPGLEGQKTASGETFDSKEMVAAHRSYPMGTIVRVTNLENGDTVTVRVSDHGPTKENRDEGVIIDLSKGAAKKIRMIGDGRVRVKVEVLSWGKDSIP